MNIIDANRELIEAALEHGGGTHTFEDIKAGILAGEMQIWPAKDTVAITQVLQYPAKKVLHVFVGAGDMQELIRMIDSAAHWGRTQQGCTAMTLAGRKGWERALAPHGFKPTMTVMERAI